MNKSYRIAIVTMAVAATMAVAQSPSQGQTTAPQDDQAARAAARARRNAQNFENNASVITFYDRQGKTAGTAGERALYNWTVLSPDKTRVAVVTNDQEAENADLWILDVASGKSTRMTTSTKGEFVDAPVWSPDGRHVAYVQIRNGNEGLYRRLSNGEGPEELLYRNPSAFMDLSDWSLDGRFLTFAKSDLTGGALYVLPLNGQGERAATEVFRSESRVFGPRFSPDGRFLSYVLAESGERNKIFVRPIDRSTAAGPWEVAEGNTHSWRRNGGELYFVGVDRAVMAVEVSTASSFTFGKPRVLFRPPGVVPLFVQDISRDGERFLMLPPRREQQLQQVTLYDRAGKVVKKVGEPGLYIQPSFSPDGTRVVVLKNDTAQGQRDIWTFDIASGKGTRVTDSIEGKNNPMWSPDGRHILYSSNRGSYTGIYRVASNGTGREEFLFRYTPGAPVNLTDISPDGKFLACVSGGVVLIVPLTGSDPLARQALEFSREEFSVGNGRFSPDGRFLAYTSNEANPDPDTGRNEVYVRQFDASTGTAGEGKWQLSKEGAAGMQFWRGDGKEFLFRQGPRPTDPATPDLIVMSTEVSITPTFKAGTPAPLFTLPGPQGGSLGNISRDGQRFVFVVNIPANAPSR